MEEKKLNEIVGVLTQLQMQVNRAYFKTGAGCDASFSLEYCKEIACREYEFCKSDNTINYLLKELEK